MYRVIPLRTDLDHYSFEVQLDGVNFGFAFRWNARDESWWISFSNGLGEPLVSSLKAVVDVPLLNRFRDYRLPQGTLMLLDTTGTGVSPGRDELGTRVQLVYVDAEDVEAIEEEALNG